MRDRWVRVVAYTVVVLLQAGVLVGANVVHGLARERMMLSRWLLAKNLKLEELWFSPLGEAVQAAVLVAGAIASLIVVYLAYRRCWGSFLTIQAALGAVIAASAAWFLLATSTTGMITANVWAIALWVVLILQSIVIVVAYSRKEDAQCPSA